MGLSFWLAIAALALGVLSFGLPGDWPFWGFVGTAVLARLSYKAWEKDPNDSMYRYRHYR